MWGTVLPNVEASMLMHTKGCLIMTMDGSGLTGKKALDFSGSVSAEDERGIGGAERIMGQTARLTYCLDLGDVHRILNGTVSATKGMQQAPRRLNTLIHLNGPLKPPHQSHESEGFAVVGDIFQSTKQSRSKETIFHPYFCLVIDQDFGHLERFAHIRDANAVVWETHWWFPGDSLGIGLARCQDGDESQWMGHHSGWVEPSSRAPPKGGTAINGASKSTVGGS